MEESGYDNQRLHLFVRDILLCKELSDGIIPEGVRRLIHEKSMERSAGHQHEGCAVIFDIKDKSTYLLRCHGSISCLQDGGYLFRYQMQHEAKGCGGAFSLN